MYIRTYIYEYTICTYVWTICDILMINIIHKAINRHSYVYLCTHMLKYYYVCVRIYHLRT